MKLIVVLCRGTPRAPIACFGVRHGDIFWVVQFRVKVHHHAIEMLNLSA